MYLEKHVQNRRKLIKVYGCEILEPSQEIKKIRDFFRSGEASFVRVREDAKSNGFLGSRVSKKIRQLVERFLAA